MLMDKFINVENDSFPVALTKTFVASTVISAGVITGFIVAGYGVTKFNEMRDNRKAKKNLPTTV